MEDRLPELAAAVLHRFDLEAADLSVVPVASNGRAGDALGAVDIEATISVAAVDSLDVAQRLAARLREELSAATGRTLRCVRLRVLQPPPVLRRPLLG